MSAQTTEELWQIKAACRGPQAAVFFPPAQLGRPLYARVDALRGGDGRLTLLELEALEPFLFFETDPEAAPRFARAVESWLRP